jgi:restriction endonuclease S subunit
VAGQVSELLSNRRVSELAEYADVTYGLTVNPARRQSADRLPYLRVANVLRGGFDLSEVKDIGTIDGDQGYALLSRDVLIVEGHADPSQIGRCAVWNGQIPQALHQNHLIRVRCSESLLPAYVSLLINSTHGQRYFRSHAKSSSGLSTINSTVVKRYSLPMPEIGVQRKLVMRAKLFSDARVSIQSREQALAGMQGALLRAIGGDQ